MTELRWRRVDDYHMRSQDGRFSIARLNCSPRCWYVAFKLPFSESSPPTEIGATTVSMDASDAERLLAVRDLQQICEAEA